VHGRSISCVITSEFEDKDLTTSDGVINTVNYDISDKSAEMFLTWGEYLEKTLQRVNARHAKSIYFVAPEQKGTSVLDTTTTQRHFASGLRGE